MMAASRACETQTNFKFMLIPLWLFSLQILMNASYSSLFLCGCFPCRYWQMPLIQAYSSVIVFLADIDECLLDNNCDQECVDELDGYSCGCYDGFRLADDAVSCIGKYICNIYMGFTPITLAAQQLMFHSCISVTKACMDSLKWNVNKQWFACYKRLHGSPLDPLCVSTFFWAISERIISLCWVFIACQHIFLSNQWENNQFVLSVYCVSAHSSEQSVRE